MDAGKILSSYVPGTKAWFTDKEAGWISATLARAVQKSSSGDVTLEFTLDDGGATREVKTSLSKIEEAAKSGSTDDVLPPLRNPPLLEATDDLTNLSYLNEPAGE